MSVTIIAYYGKSKTGKKKDRPKFIRIKDGVLGGETKILADSTDMARLWGKVRRWHGDTTSDLE